MSQNLSNVGSLVSFETHALCFLLVYTNTPNTFLLKHNSCRFVRVTWILSSFSSMSGVFLFGFRVSINKIRIYWNDNVWNSWRCDGQMCKRTTQDCPHARDVLSHSEFIKKHEKQHNDHHNTLQKNWRGRKVCQSLCFFCLDHLLLWRISHNTPAAELYVNIYPNTVCCVQLKHMTLVL